MSHEDMENYRESLRHIVRPEDPSERVQAAHVTLEDYEALYLYDGLVEYAAYEAPSREAEQIALGYAEYIHMVIKQEDKGRVNLYMHTSDAAEVLLSGIDARSKGVEELNNQVFDKIAEAVPEV
jgi:hypothetical protein